jgi:hypothetical protein
MSLWFIVDTTSEMPLGDQAPPTIAGAVASVRFAPLGDTRRTVVGW